MKTRSFYAWLWGSIFFGVTLTSGCAVSESGFEASMPDIPASLPTVRLTNRSVLEIDSVAAEQVDQTVAIAGTVTQRVALLDGWLYQVSDDSGSLWVLTHSSAPALDEAVTVEGIVRYEAIVVEEIDAGEIYLEETADQQREAQR